jgi:hypothetical protein
MTTRDGLLEAAKTGGVKENERFDWLVDRALELPAHSQALSGEAGTERRLRPEFERLFAKFRIGKSYYTFRDPASGAEVRAPIVRCSDCHAEAAVAASDPVGSETSAAMLRGMRELIGTTARAERVTLAARRGGVETRRAQVEIDKAVDDQIELEVMVHGFSSGPQSAFAAKQTEGLGFAKAALAAGREALGELGFRRRGLGVALGFCVLFLIALGLKIRQMGPH